MGSISALSAPARESQVREIGFFLSRGENAGTGILRLRRAIRKRIVRLRSG